ncbi:MarR family winged helix-turn-helix transcriptional regulator [Microbacterium aquimaris]|uniref:MarR family transcriptional regulator n=1 Tax=Microbacterium aquimaris TaxID=459816 RepID=A0ABU5N322_9MICO|nr:MarR family transcriptional regulator [Microbacterium aquimaris]MDZ8160487.1 MarR family transcriptional regulator [Microbacterium aquimaris]
MVHVNVSALVSVVGAAVDGHVREHLVDRGFEGLHLRHGYVFQRLLTGPQSISDLGRSLEVTQQAMSQTVGELQRRGYVESAPDPSDARRKLVRLSSRGRAAVAAAREARAEVESRLVARVEAVDLQAARRVIEELADVLHIGDALATREVPVPDGLVGGH